MNSQIRGLKIASFIFGLICLAQLLRLVFRVEVVIAGNPVPFWASALACVILGGLSFWMYRLASAAANP